MGVAIHEQRNSGRARIGRRSGLSLSLILVAGIALGARPAGAVESFPSVRPATRAQAVASLTAGMRLPIPCLSPKLQSLLEDPARDSLASVRALGLLQAAGRVSGERRVVEQDGTTIRFTLQRGTFDRLDGGDENGDGRPDLVEAVLDGIGEAREILVSQLGLPAPDPVEILLARVGSDIDGYTIPAGGVDGRPLLVLDVSGRGLADARKIAAHQYAHAVAVFVGAGIGPDWAEAVATWTVLRSGGEPDDATIGILSERLQRLPDGLLADDLVLAAGNAAWLSFVEEEYGPTALRLTVEELARGGASAVALERALLRSSGETLAAAFREFQLWSLLVGERQIALHFPFAARCTSPRFVLTSEGLPALSVHADPPVAPLGAAAVLLRPEATEGGVALRFEGEGPGRWDVDLLLVREDGALQRVPLRISSEGRGEIKLPLRGLVELILMVRNPDPEARGARRFSWSAYALRGYPVEFAGLDAVVSPRAGEGVLVRWETRSEKGVLGFNVLRREEGLPGVVRINPVWVPALGEEFSPGAYQFLDRGAEPGVAYLYQIEAITEAGLASESPPLAVTPDPLAPR